jgi:zinc protease
LSYLASYLAAAVVLCAQATAPALPRGVEKVTSVEGITEYRLDNGLRVLMFPDPTKDTITVNITYLVGSRHENYGETGMAHLLEHLVFKGTPRHPNIPQELTAHGTRPNGTTWFDRTNYFETFAATDENLRWALDLEADRMVNSFIAKKDLDSEMTVVRNEYEMGENSPQGVLFKRVLAAAFDWHNYGKSTIGSKADLENVPIDRLQAFYKRYYQPDNSILTVAGKIDEPKTLALVAEYFGRIPRPERKLQPTYTLEPVQDGERMISVRRVGDIQAVLAAYHIPDGAHADSAAIDVLTEIMRSQPNGRLYKALVESKKASAASAFQFSLREPGLALFMAQVRKDDNLDEATKTLLSVVEEFASAPPTKEETDRAKTAILKNHELALRNSTEIGLTLSEPAAAGDWRLWFLSRDRVKNVTPEDVQRVAKAYLKRSNRTAGAFHPTDNPDRAEIPAPTDVASVLKDYKGGEAIAAGEFFDPSIANVRKRLTTSQLPSGVKVALVPKKTRGNIVQAQVSLHYGTVESLKGTSTAAQIAAAMLNRGTSKHTRQQINDELNRLKARAYPFAAGPGAVRFNIETIAANLPEVMKLVGEMLREPAFPESEFEIVKRQQIAQFEQYKREPQALAGIAIEQHLSPYPKDDPRYVQSLDERVESLTKLTLDDVKSFYKRFYGASTGELVVVGEFEPEAVQTLARTLFGDWKSPGPHQRIARTHHSVAAVNKMFETPDKANAMLVGGLNLKISDEHADYPALVLGNYLLGGGFLNSRLATRIRQKEGLSYGVGSQFSAGPKDEAGQFGTYAIAAPQNVPKVEAAIREELAKALKEGFTEQEIAEGKKGWLQSRNVSRANDNELASQLSGLLYLERTLEFQEKLEAAVSALTADVIVAALRRHVDPAQMSFIKAGDFKKAGVTQ